MKGRPIIYSEEQLAFVEANATLSIREMHAAFAARFPDHGATADHLAALRKRKGWKTGRTGHFPKRNTPFNKGLKGFSPAGSEKGWFRPGFRCGRAHMLYRPVGTERLDKNGYLERKVHDGHPAESRWQHVHLMNWEAVNGPLLAGHALKCLDGDRTNVAADNWVAVPRALLPRLAGWIGRGRATVAYDTAPADLKPTLLQVARLNHAVRTAGKAAP